MITVERFENSAKRAAGISFRRAAKNCSSAELAASLIPLNGRLALKLNPGQPHKTDSFITVVLSAYPPQFLAGLHSPCTRPRGRSTSF
jgi:hypothetical protein